MSFLDTIKGKLPFGIGGKSNEGEIAPVAPETETESYNPLIESAIKAETENSETSILDSSVIDQSLLEDIEPPKSLLLYILKGVFIIFLILGAGTYLFFASQLDTYLKFATDTLGLPAAMNELNSKNDELRSLQTDLNVYNLLEGKFYLDNFSFEGDKFARNYQIFSNKSVEEANRDAANAEMTKLREVLKTNLIGARDKLLGNFHITLVDPSVLDAAMYPSIFEGLLKDRIAAEILALEGKTTPEEMRDYKTFSQASKLIGNTTLNDLLRTTDIDALSDEQLVKFIVQLNGFTGNELSSMQKIKDAKMSWSAIINEIKNQTRIVDQYFSDGVYDDAGGIQYTNYDFDAATSKINISGSTKRYDSKNFSTISDLIVELNASPMFKGVEMKSFSKSGSSIEGYTATLRLTLELQKGEVSPEDKPLDVNSVPDFLVTPKVEIPVKPAVNAAPVTPAAPKITAPVIN